MFGLGNIRNKPMEFIFHGIPANFFKLAWKGALSWFILLILFEVYPLSPMNFQSGANWSGLMLIVKWTYLYFFEVDIGIWTIRVQRTSQWRRNYINEIMIATGVKHPSSIRFWLFSRYTIVDSFRIFPTNIFLERNTWKD